MIVHRRCRMLVISLSYLLRLRASADGCAVQQPAGRRDGRHPRWWLQRVPDPAGLSVFV